MTNDRILFNNGSDVNSVVSSTNPLPVKPGLTPCLGQEQILAATLAASTSLASIPVGATWAILKARTQGIYLRLTGGTATSADMAISPDVAVEVTATLSNVRMLQQAAGAIVDVWYF